jgi:hypothetical protein
MKPKTVLNSEHIYVWYSSLHVTGEGVAVFSLRRMYFSFISREVSREAGNSIQDLLLSSNCI